GALDVLTSSLSPGFGRAYSSRVSSNGRGSEMQTIHFNTGRLYTALGQRITATLHDDGVVTFYDHSRGIDGELKYPLTVFAQATVTRNYDLGEWSGTHRSMRDGLYVDGVNSKYEG